MTKRFLLLGGALALIAATASAQAGPYRFFSVTPCRIVDTRGPTGVLGGPALVQVTPRNFPIDVSPAACGVPNTATAAALNVTFITPTADGFIKIWPYLATEPTVSTVNALAGEPAIANGAIVPLTSNPSFNITVKYGTPAPSATAHLVLDVNGYFAP